MFELVGASTRPPPLAGSAARGLTRFVGRQTELEALQPGPGAGRGRAWPGGGAGWRGRASASRAWCTSLCTPTAPRAGWCWKAPRCPTARRRPYFPVHRPAQALCPCRGARRPPHHPRQGDRAGADARRGPPGHHPGAAGAAGRPAGRQPVSAARSAPAPPAHARRPSSACCCAKARCNRCCWSSRICTGSMPRRRPCSTAWSRACPRPACCCWSTTVPSTSTAGAARPTTPNCGSTRCRRPAPTNSCRPCWGTTPAWRRSSSC